MNVKDKILNLNQEHAGKSADINDLLLTIITKFQLFEPCSYLSEDDEWLNVSLISIEDNSVGQALTIRKSEITTFGIFNREEIEDWMMGERIPTREEINIKAMGYHMK